MYSRALFYRISLNWYMHYNNYNGNWHPTTTTYQILAPGYKSIVDIEDFG
jgi:hypothetical protein